MTVDTIHSLIIQCHWTDLLTAGGGNWTDMYSQITTNIARFLSWFAHGVEPPTHHRALRHASPGATFLKNKPFDHTCTRFSRALSPPCLSDGRCTSYTT